MTTWTVRSLRATVLATALTVLLAASVTAHTGEGVSLEHVIIEVGTYALAVAGVIAAIVLVFWIRARRHPSE
jgi:hypothetical protein